METKKQESWFHTDVDFENSFKYWFALQWQNKYIQIFFVFFTLLTLQLINFETVWGWLIDSYKDSTMTGIFVTPFMFLPLAGVLIVAYKGFYQYFNDLKNGRSR
jgi:hypothetical protein